jgi:hypothetical protein
VPSKKQRLIARELAEHPWLSGKQAARIVRDHERDKRSVVKPSTFRKFQNRLRKAIGLKPKKVKK